MNQRRELPLLVAVETDPLRYHGEHAVRPVPLDPPSAEQLLAHVGADLSKLFPKVRRHGLVMSGALYDQAQVLRPGYPLFHAMADVAQRRWQREGGRTGLLSIGAAGGHLPSEELVPDASLPPGILQLLPLQLHGDAGELEALEDEMEHRFMEEGQLSVHSARALEQSFRIATTHVRFMTMTDLQAMLKMQLEHFGFEALWTLLDAALEGDPGPVEVLGSAGQNFCWREHAVHARFETFDHWANRGEGADQPADRLAEGYIAWTREYRQILITLAAHDVPLSQHLPNDHDPLDGLFLEEDAGPADSDTAAVTEHDGGDLGTLAVTVTHGGRLRHLYPLAPEGANALHAHIATLGMAHGGLSYPGRLCIDEDRRRLAADDPG
jgi:hypothetical protein